MSQGYTPVEDHPVQVKWLNLSHHLQALFLLGCLKERQGASQQVATLAWGQSSHLHIAWLTLTRRLPDIRKLPLMISLRASVIGSAKRVCGGLDTFFDESLSNIPKGYKTCFMQDNFALHNAKG